MSDSAGEADAIVVRRTQYGDTDLIVGLYTREHGLVSALARGARRSKKRFGAAIGVFAHVRPELTRRRSAGLWTLSSANLVDAHADLAADVATFAHASYATEVVRELAPPEQPEEALIELLLEMYRGLRALGAVPAMLRAFELKLLSHHGVAPDFAGCPQCGADKSTRWLFDPEQGGALCESCAAFSRGQRTREISAGARTYLSALSAAALQDAAKIDATADTRLETRELLVGEILANTGKMLRSLEFVRQLNSAPGSV